MHPENDIHLTVLPCGDEEISPKTLYYNEEPITQIYYDTKGLYAGFHVNPIGGEILESNKIKVRDTE